MEVKYLSEPPVPITVLVIGAGGNGSQMMQQLGRIDCALRGLGKPGLFVALIDDDKVSEANCGRQLFNPADIGEYKSTLITSRINRFYGTTWWAIADRFTAKKWIESTNVLITCTDNVESRLEAQAWCEHFSKKRQRSSRHETTFHYWIDLGNSKTTGQVICGSPVHALPTVIDMYPKAKKMESRDDTPSCSLAEALGKQDMFINTFVSNIAGKLFWEMCTQKEINWRGAYINLDTFNIKKIVA